MPARASVAAGEEVDAGTAAAEARTGAPSTRPGTRALAFASPAPSAGERGVSREHAPEERIIAAALAELPASGSILLDAGPIAEQLARSLPAECGLTVITNSMPVAMALIVRGDVTVQLIGGRIAADSGATVGGYGASGLEGIEVDVAFMAADGVSAGRGLTARAPAESAAKRTIMRAAGRVVVLASADRIGQIGLASFGTLEDVDCLITDSPCDTAAGRRVSVGVQHLTRV